MFEHHVKACEMDEAEEVFDVVFPSGKESAEVLHPCEEPFHFSSLAISPELASILSVLSATAPVGCDHFDVVFGGKLLVERVRVVGLVADEPCGKFVEEATGQNAFHKLALGRRSTFDRYCERKTVISGDSDDFRTLAAPGGADSEAPFLALAKVASTNASSRFSLPCLCSRAARSLSASSNLPLRTHCWNRRWQVWKGGYFSGSSRHCAPVPSTHSTPFSTARVSCHGRPRLSARRGPRKTGSTINHCSSVNSQRPAMRHSRDHTEQFQNAPVLNLKGL
jgi:hypothetical protein